MTALHWTVLAVALCAATVFATQLYLRHEASVPGRGLLASLRTLTIVLAVLLLLDPRLPGSSASSGGERWILLDASASMGASGTDGASAWGRATTRALEAAGGEGTLILWGEEIRPLSPDSLGSVIPDGSSTRLADALRRAAESGAASALVVSDLRLQDPVAAGEAVAALPFEVAFERIPSQVTNAALAEVALPDRIPARTPVRGEVVLALEGADSARVEVREGDRLLFTGTALPEGAGAAETGAAGASPRAWIRLPIELPGMEEEGAHFFMVSLAAANDGFARDDTMRVAIRVGPAPGRLALLSLEPGWEPRYLLPVLEDVTGLEGRGFLRIGADRFIGLGGGDEGGAPAEPIAVDSAEVRRLLENAELVVLHGAGEDAPPWLPPLVARSTRILVLATAPEGTRLLGVETGAPAAGERYSTERPPPSPIGGTLAEVRTEGLPPLTALLPLRSETQGIPVWTVGERGREEGAVLVGESGDRRWSLALADGFWRWAARPGPARETYRRLWGGVAGWLLEGEGRAPVRGFEPVDLVVPGRDSIAWTGRPGPVRLRIAGVDAEPLLDTILRVPADGRVATSPLPPGEYAYTATLLDPADTLGRGEDPSAPAIDPGISAETGASQTPPVTGGFVVDPHLREMLPAPWIPPAVPGEEGAAAGRDGEGRVTPGRPLRLHPLPYILLVLLLSAEWIARRRVGLR